MTSEPGRPIERWLLRWSRAVRRRRHVVLLATAALTAGGLFYTARHLGVDTDTSSLVSDDLEFRRTYQEYVDAFPHLQDELTVLIVATSPGLADVSAGRLAAALAADTANFRSVHRLDGGPFFERYGLLFRDADTLDAMVARLERMSPILADLQRSPGLSGLVGALERAAREDATDAAGEEAGLDLRPLLGLLAGASYAALEGRFVPVPWSALADGRAPAPADHRQTLSVRPRLTFANAVPGRAAIDRVREVARELGLIERNGVQVLLTGTVAIESEELDSAVAGVRQAGLLALGSVALILFLALRSPKLILACLATLLAGLIATSAFAALAIGHLNLISVAFAVLYVGLGIDYAIHLTLRYRELRAAGWEADAAVDAAVQQIGPSLALSAVTTAACFYAFIPTDFTGVSELGVIGGTGMFVSLTATLTILPAMLATLPIATPRRSRGAGGLRRLGRWVGAHRRAIVPLAVLSAAAAGFLLPRARFDHYALNLRDPDSESVRAYRSLLADPQAKPLTVSALRTDAATARALADSVAALPEVAWARTLTDFVPGDQEQKLAVLARLDRVLTADDARSPGEGADAWAALARLRAALDEVRWRGTAAERELSRRLLHVLRAWERRAEGWGPESRARQAETLEAALVGALPDRLRALGEAARLAPLALDDLPPELRERWIGKGGEWRVEIAPAGALLTTDELTRFVQSVRGVAPHATGGPVNELGTGRVAVAAFRDALLWAAAVTGVLLLVFLRSLGGALLVVVPLGMAAAWTGALTVLLEIPFNFANVIALPLLLGVGVDNGIHMVHEARNGGAAGRDPLASSTGRAVLFATLTTIASFGNLAFAVHVGMSSMGRLLTVGMSCVLLATLVVLPALLGVRAEKAS